VVGSPCNKPHPRPKQQTGFSLLELLIAFVVMALVIGGILQLFGTSLRSVAIAEEYSYAVQLAESQLMLVGNEYPIEESTHSGTAEDSKYAWTINISSTELPLPEGVPALPLYPYQVIVTVSWANGTRHRRYHLRSLRNGEES